MEKTVLCIIKDRKKIHKDNSCALHLGAHIPSTCIIMINEFLRDRILGWYLSKNII